MCKYVCSVFRHVGVGSGVGRWARMHAPCTFHAAGCMCVLIYDHMCV